MTVKNNDVVLFEDAEVAFLNFSGNEGEYNKTGEKQFCILLTDQQADSMFRDGWNVKRLKPKEDQEVGTPYIQVTAGYKIKPPRVVMLGDQSKRRTELGEATVALLDDVEIGKVDLMIRAREYDVNGHQGIKAYLKSMYITIVEDYLELKYARIEDENNG